MTASLVGILATAVVLGAGPNPAPGPGTQCGNPAAYVGGTVLPLDGGGQLWFRVAGRLDGLTLVIVHGGPGSNSYNFEKSVGTLIEPHLRVVYLDQRGGGRSANANGRPQLGMKATVDDIERVRQHLHAEQVVLLGHSFGGLVALEYEREYPRRVAGLVLVETTADLPAAITHQIQTLARLAPERFPEHAIALSRILADQSPPFERLRRCYDELGRIPLQRAIAFASDAGQSALETWDSDNAFKCGANVAKAYVDEGWLDHRHSELARKLRSPVVLLAGRHSDVIGADAIKRSAETWGASVVWFEHSGHFPNIEEPEAFARAVVSFTRSLMPTGVNGH